MKEGDKNKRYFEAVGRRKTALARVRLMPNDKGANLANGQSFEAYFKTPELLAVIHEPLGLITPPAKLSISAKLRGGGINAQAGALRHGIARAIVLYQKDLRPIIKKQGLLTRDSRMKERRKFGLKKARKAPQWSKR